MLSLLVNNPNDILMETPFDPKAKYYKCTCPRCGVTHTGKDHNEAIGGKDQIDALSWHKKDCIFINDAVYTTFDAIPVYSLGRKIIRIFKK